MSGARRVGDLLAGGDSVLSTLIRGSRRQQALDKQFNALIDAPLSEHVQVASAHDGVLTLAADSAVWGHRIRYMAPTVLEQLRRIDPSLEQVKIMVRPPRSEAVAPPLPQRRANLSPSSASLLDGVAKQCNNPALTAVLARLSKLARHDE